MKVKLLCIVFLLSFCFLTSCQPVLEMHFETAEEKVTTEEEKEPEFPKVGKPLTWDQIRAIPVADNTMSSEELRKICTDYMRLQLTFEWTPSRTLKYYFQTRGYMMEFPAGQVYGGLPYKTFDANGNLYIVMDYYDSQTGVLDPGTIAGANFFEIIGNDCASGPFWAWSRVINSITNFKDFQNKSGFTNIGLTPQNNLIPVGDYESISEGTWDDGDGTQAICLNNGQQKMYECYAKLQEADGLIHLYPNGARTSHNHLMMASSKATVVKNEDGTINGDRSFVTIMDQESHKTKKLTENGLVNYEGGIDVVFTFSRLFEERYIPFTFKEFLGTDPVEKAEVELKVEGDIDDYEALQKGTLFANYGISHLRIKVLDPQGEEVYSYCHIPKLCDTRIFSMKNLLRPASKWHAKEENTFVITAFLGTGEEFEVLRGTVLDKSKLDKSE